MNQFQIRRVANVESTTPDFPQYIEYEQQLTQLQFPVSEAQNLYHTTIDGLTIPGPAKTALKLAFDDVLTAVQTLQTDPIMTELFALQGVADAQSLSDTVRNGVEGLALRLVGLLITPSTPPLPGTLWELVGWMPKFYSGDVVICVYVCTAPGYPGHP